MAQLAKIAIEAATYAIDKPYDYLVPDGMELCAGMRVTVPFGRGNRRSEGMVLAVESGLPDRKLKAVESVLDEVPQLQQEQIRLALWMCQRYFCTFYDALHAILPIGLWYQHREIWFLCREADGEKLTDKEKVLLQMLQRKEQCFSDLQAAQPQARTMLQKMQALGLVNCRQESSRRAADKTDKLISLTISPAETEALLREKRSKAPRQADALAFLLNNGETSLHELLYFTGVSRQAITKMVQSEILSLREQEVFRVPLRPMDRQAPEIHLNREQQRAYDEILQRIHGGHPGGTLLQGVTGSGKTEVYICLAKQLLSEGKTALILVPEIALTPQMMQRFSMYFGEEVALLHSALGIAERYDQYKRIRQGKAKIVLGTPDSLWVDDLELIYRADVNGISVKGTPVEGFSADKADYSLTAAGELAPDDITVDVQGQGALVTKTLAKTFTGMKATIEVMSADYQTTHTYTLTVRGATPTGIDSAQTDAQTSARTYTLDGLQVKAPRKGIVYVQGGKKIFKR